jgi:hypothetical protein
LSGREVSETKFSMIEGPLPAELIVNVPKELLVTTISLELERPLFVNVRVPAPTGVEEGSTAATCVGVVYIMIASTVVEPTFTWIDVPSKPCEIGSGNAGERVACGVQNAAFRDNRLSA